MAESRMPRSMWTREVNCTFAFYICNTSQWQYLGQCCRFSSAEICKLIQMENIHTYSLQLCENNF